ncbi:hypothetical protein B7463_g440, partial [Scytalidium lignicola]
MSDQPPGDYIAGKSRSRSNTNTTVSVKSRKRPASRASTTSVHSGVTQPALDQQLGDAVSDYQKQWFEDANAQQRFDGIGNQMTPEDMVMHSVSQLQSTRQYGLDPIAVNAVNHSLAYPQASQYAGDNGRHSLPADGYVTQYGDGDSQMIEGRSDEQDDMDSQAGVGEPAKKPSKSSAANELEMRQLFQANKHRKLPEIAAELHGNERGPQSERQRQVFAMLWINQVCSKGKGSVPRGRVYANYVSRCATERVTVLNPASFGKLVRVLFPALKTRRLGVRGESKYHYVNFSLKDDQPELSAAQQSAKPSSNGSTPFVQSYNIPSQPQYGVITSPSPQVLQAYRHSVQLNKGFIAPHSLYHQPEIHSISHLESTTGKVHQRLKFAPPPEPNMQEYEPISLPNIEPFLPAGTDQDAATALTAVYRSHCTSLVECIRFCKEKTFFHLFTSFHGTLTMPVQKLFANPALAPWIEECDFVMYQKMMRVVAPLTLQVVPKQVLDALRNISERLVQHIRDSFQSQPSHVIEAKVASATLFAGLLDRELRVNLTAHAAANMLSNPANRDQMYEDWITMVRTRKVAECVPTRGMDDVVNLLLTELRNLLNPMAVPWDVEGLTPYGEMALRTGRQQEANIHADPTTENVLDRWVNFLNSLPGKFPYATDAEVVWCVEKVGTAVLRDLTINQGKSFGAWWVTKCWIDEMIVFMAEQGGFMEYKSSRSSKRDTAKQSSIPRGANQLESRYSSVSEDFLKTGGHSDGGITVPHPMDITSHAAINAAAGHDDSGISMRSPDDEFNMEKYGYAAADSHVQINSNGLEHAMA